MVKRQQTKLGRFRQKRGDTDVGSVEKTYKVNFGVRSDMKLNTYLKREGLPSLGKTPPKLGTKTWFSRVIHKREK